MIGLRRGQFGPKATPSQRDTIQKRALWHLGSDCDRARCLLCAIAGTTGNCCREGRAST